MPRRYDDPRWFFARKRALSDSQVRRYYGSPTCMICGEAGCSKRECIREAQRRLDQTIPTRHKPYVRSVYTVTLEEKPDPIHPEG